MKKMKKLTRENLKDVKGAGGPTYPDDLFIIATAAVPDGILQRKKSCMDINGNYYPPICQ
jgi:hypothetical protein